MQSHEQSRLRHNLVAIFSLIAAVTIILLFASGLSTLTLRPGGSLNTLAALLAQARPAEIEAPSTSALTSVISGKPVLENVALDSLAVNIVEDASGKSNLDGLFVKDDKKKAVAITVESLAINNVSLAVAKADGTRIAIGQDRLGSRTIGRVSHR